VVGSACASRAITNNSTARGDRSPRENRNLYFRSVITMKNLSIIIAVFVLVFGTVASRADNVDRISAATGVPVATLEAERASTGLGWGSLENAHLLANATGQSFDNIVALHQGGQGWGKIARDNNLKLGTLVSNAHRSSNATMHAKNTQTTHGKSGTHAAKGHSAKMRTTRGNSHRSSSFSGSRGTHSIGHMGRSHGIGSMGHMSGSRGMGSMGHGGGRGHGR